MARATAIQLDAGNLALISKSSACRSVGNLGAKSLADNQQQNDPNPDKEVYDRIAKDSQRMA